MAAITTLGFLFKPGEIAAYFFSLLKGKPAHYVGHNPLGSVAIWLLLGLGIASGVTGFMVFQDVGGDALEELHELVSNAMLAVVFIHIAGVIVSSVLHRENLVRSMISGFKSAEPEQAIKRSHLWLGVIILAAVLAFWAGYPATGIVAQGAEKTHEHEHHQHDD
jgi:cytochrome b